MSIIQAFIVPHPPIIVPEIGKGEENKISSTIKSYQEVARRIAEIKPDTIVLTSPHSIMYADYIHISPGKEAEGDFGNFGAKKISIKAEYDEEFVKVLSEMANTQEINAGTLGERDSSLDHGTLVPLYFVNQFYKEYKLVRIGLSGLPLINHYHFGKCIADTADKLNKKVVFVASGDLSHRLKEDGPYGFTKEGVQFDKEVTKAMKEGDFLQFLSFSPSFCDLAAECGLRSFIIMAGALSGKAVKTDFLSYEGPFGVGYAVCAYEITKADEGRDFDIQYEGRQREILKERKSGEDPYVQLARASLETYILTGEYVRKPEGLLKELSVNQAGVFVSLKLYGELRGCIGTISPVTDSIADEIIRNAVSAGLEDPRFCPVTKEELSKLVYSVDVLSKPEKIKSIEELDVKRFGVIVTSGRKRGLLLPNLEGVDTPEQQLEIAMRKAGIEEDDRYSLERFEVVRHR